MSHRYSSRWIGVLLFLLLLAATRPAGAASHQWRFNELFSNADGTIQFIEMQECCGFNSEWALQSKWILVVHANHKYTFRSSLTGNTANKYLLLATQGFADIPGAPEGKPTLGKEEPQQAPAQAGATPGSTRIPRRSAAPERPAGS